VQHKRCLFGEIIDAEMKMNDIGNIVHEEWHRASKIRPNVELDEFVVMPNHIHGIIILHDFYDDYCRGMANGIDTNHHGRGTLQRAPTDGPQNPNVERFGKPTSNSIPTIARLFKSATTKRINEFRHTPGMPLWQRDYFEHIIRGEKDLTAIRKYILNNPIQWSLDKENPDRILDLSKK
jgi:REP element-mobilizing transposase RayT